ncbi:MAG: acetyl-CoA carboxylase biotin carboxylase subunit [Candidatus Stahlbacteria bacterium]|nr:MAG: acetyl-CoA carboxylase biotin carboxylase subunit [Candidatus Stahlbacteria bacterium]
MFSKVLVVNRGEIAVRIIRACKELGIRTVAVYSEADADALHPRLADEAVCIGPPPSSESYLKVTALISAAEVSGCDAVHPGYGFLAENAAFAQMVTECGLTFIGPTADNIAKMGNKSFAKQTMRKAGVPVIPGSRKDLVDVEEARKLAAEFGYPVLLKAAAGGGGKGMRLANDRKELEAGYKMAKAEAKAAFGDDRLYLEKCIEKPRHVEIQVIGDKHGKVVHLAERECSIQRRHQKLIEESPSPAVDEELRKKMGDAAVAAAKAIGYQSAGTVEFLLDPGGNFYFMEMNTRIQVEHPVTEMVTGYDLLKEQIRVAQGSRLGIRKSVLKPNGHSIECRINAEDPDRDFMPSAGRIEFLHLPGGPGVRVDTHIFAGYVIPTYYDSLIAKVISHGATRAEAIARMKRALEEFYTEGIKTTVPFHLKVLDDAEFRAGNLHTGFIAEMAEREKAKEKK